MDQKRILRKEPQNECSDRLNLETTTNPNCVSHINEEHMYWNVPVGGK